MNAATATAIVAWLVAAGALNLVGLLLWQHRPGYWPVWFAIAIMAFRAGLVQWHNGGHGGADLARAAADPRLSLGNWLGILLGLVTSVAEVWHAGRLARQKETA